MYMYPFSLKAPSHPGWHSAQCYGLFLYQLNTFLYVLPVIAMIVFIFHTYSHITRLMRTLIKRIYYISVCICLIPYLAINALRVYLNLS